MNARSIILAIVWVLCASVFAIIYLATRETYDLFVQGEEKQAKVVNVSNRDGVRVTVEYEVAGKLHQTGSEFATDSDASLKAGDTVAIKQHRNVPWRATLKSALDEARPTPWLWSGSAACLALSGYTLMLPSLRRKRRAARKSALEVITDSLRRTRTRMGILSVGIVAFGGALVWLGASGADKTASTAVNIGAAVMGGSFAVVGLLIFSRGWKLRSIDRSPIMRRILESPGDIVWIYELVVQSAIAGKISADKSVHVWFSDGGSYSISVDDADARALIDELHKRAPHAHVGYDVETERRYRKSPSTFAGRTHRNDRA